MELLSKVQLCCLAYKLPSETEYSFCKRLTGEPLLKESRITCLSEDGAEGFVAINPVTHHATVVFRGTDELSDWEFDLEVRPTRSLVGVGRVRSGVQRLFIRLWPAVKEVLIDNLVTTVSVIGHSLGAMLAELSVAWFKSDLPNIHIQDVTTFAGCPVGNSEFSDFVTSNSGSVLHVAAIGDPLPFAILARLIGYRWSGVAVILDETGRVAPLQGILPWLRGIRGALKSLILRSVRSHRCSEYVRRLEDGLEKTPKN